MRLPDVTAEMITYSHIRYGLYFVGIALQVFLWWLLLHTGKASIVRDLAIRLSKGLFVEVAIALGLFLLFIFCLSLPLTFIQSFWLDHHFSLSQESFVDWWFDRSKSFLVTYILLTVSLFIFFSLVRHFPHQWPLILGLVNTPLIVLMVYIAPIAIDPIFNKYTLMVDCPLRTKIQGLLAKAGVKNASVFVVDKSRQTKKLNAYVDGIGNSARVVIWDNLLEKMPEDQTLAVVAHELGHYKLNHIYWAVGFALVINVICIAINFIFAKKFVEALPARWHVQGLSDLALIPVLFLLSTVVVFVASPLSNAVSRLFEHQADEYALALYGNREAMADAFITLSEHNLSEPDPPAVIEFWLFSHPSLKKRIDFAFHGSAKFANFYSPPPVSD